MSYKLIMDNYMITLKKKHEVIAMIDYEIEGLDDNFIYRLEIYQAADIFKCAIFKSDYYRLEVAFPVSLDIPDKSYKQDCVQFFVEEDTIDVSDLVGKSKKEIITKFEHRLQEVWCYHIKNE